ncbi:MAG: DegT/DnrJ/EryC1/StrS aminotransferase family protein, partial [Spirochaetia bacterium]
MSSAVSVPFIPFFRPSLGQEEEEAVISVMRSGWLTTGQEAARFEAEFASFVGARYALAMCSATAGLHLALEALGVSPGSIVLTTPYTFAATAEVARYLGADPCFVDIDPRTLNIDPAALESALESLSAAGRRVSAIIPVHVAGLPCDMEAIHHLSLKYGVPVVEDAAHAFPVRQGGRFAGTLGDVGVYSFYATKTITTGEGGMVVTDNEEAARRMRVMRLHGIDRDVWDRYSANGASWNYD